MQSAKKDAVIEPTRRHKGTAEGLIFGAFWNVGGLAVVLASNLMTVPIAIGVIGTSSFGDAIFVLALSSPLMLVGTILSQAVASLGTVQVARADEAKFHRILASALFFCLFGVLVFGTILALAIPALTTLGPASGVTLSDMVLVAIAGLGLRQFGILFQGAISARKHFRKLSWLVTATAIIEFTSVLIATKIAPSAIGYLTALAASSAISLCCWLLAMRSEIAQVIILYHRRIQFKQQSFALEIKALVGFTKWQGSSATAGIIVNQTNPLLLGFLASSSVLAHFNVAARLEQAISAAFGKLSEVLLPHFGHMTEESSDRLSRHFVITSFIMSTVGALLMGPMIVWAEAVLSLWIGPDFGAEGGLQLRVLATWGLINMTGSVFTMFALGTGRVEHAARIVLQYAALTLAFSVAMALMVGPEFAGIGLVLGGIFNAGRRWQVSQQFLSGHSRMAMAMLTMGPIVIAIILSYLLLGLDATMPQSWLGLIWRYAATSASILTSILIIFSISSRFRKFEIEIFSIMRSMMKKGN